MHRLGISSPSELHSIIAGAGAGKPELAAQLKTWVHLGWLKPGGDGPEPFFASGSSSRSPTNEPTPTKPNHSPTYVESSESPDPDSEVLDRGYTYPDTCFEVYDAYRRDTTYAEDFSDDEEEYYWYSRQHGARG